MTGYENLIVFAKLYDIPRRECETRVRQSLEFMGLADAADKLVREYSGGMIRRLEIAQSMLHQPRVLFLDEPTIGLDPLARKTVWEHIVSHINPLTYEVDALRALMLAGGTSTYGIELDVGTLVAALVILVIIGGRLYPRVAT